MTTLAWVGVVVVAYLVGVYVGHRLTALRYQRALDRALPDRPRPPN